MTKFEEFLQERFMEVEPQVLDDDLPDAFDSWLSQIDVDSWIMYGDMYRRELGQQIAKDK